MVQDDIHGIVMGCMEEKLSPVLQMKIDVEIHEYKLMKERTVMMAIPTMEMAVMIHVIGPILHAMRQTL